MLGTMLKDKETIEQKIEEPDRYQRDALKTTWEKVNAYTLFLRERKIHRHVAASSWSSSGELCEAAASRQPRPDGWPRDKVELGIVWKQSLAELSGG
jgi:hypothetical protein